MASLHKYRLNVAYYHAALSLEERKAVHHSWLKNEIQCIVATVAFGMGQLFVFLKMFVFLLLECFFYIYLLNIFYRFSINFISN